MHEQNPEFKTFADLMAKVGSFMLYWSSLEQQLTAAITECRTSLGLETSVVKGTVAQRIDVWFELVVQLPDKREHRGIVAEVRDQVLVLKDIRNLIVHGLAGGNSLPDDGEGYICCAVGGYEDSAGEIAKYTFSQLEDFAQGADACRRALIDLSYFNYRISPPQPAR
jgi:hypothetical protein